MKAIDELRNEIRILRNNNIDTCELVRIADAIERELEERYIEGPTDKNGVPIHIGEILQGERCDGGWCEPFKVTSMKMDNDGWVVHEFGGCGHRPKLCRHKPPTVEDVLASMCDQYRNEMHDTDFDLMAFVGEYANKFQLTEEY